MKIAIIGAGAAGLVAALTLSDRHEVWVFDEKKPGKKLLVTGNGRCNLSNTEIRANNVALEGVYSHFSRVKEILEQTDAARLISFFNAIGLATRTDSEGRVYPYTESAESVSAVLTMRCMENGVRFRQERVLLTRKEGVFTLVTQTGEFSFDRVVLACGNTAGRVGAFYDVLAGAHSYTKMQPALVPLETLPKLPDCDGLRCKADVRLKKGGKTVYMETGEILFRKYGFSGIAVMNASLAYRRTGADTLCFDFFPDWTDAELKEDLLRRRKIFGSDTTAVTEGLLPYRLILHFTRKYPNLSREDCFSLAEVCKNFEVKITGTLPCKDAQIICGGVDWREVDSSLQSKIEHGLYFCGEILDTEGYCGGYNLHFAFASALYVAKMLK